MSDVYRYLFPVMWLGWVGYWFAAARNVKPAARREPLVSRLLHVVSLTVAAAMLLPSNASIRPLGERFLSGTWPCWFGAHAYTDWLAVDGLGASPSGCELEWHHPGQAAS
jgi:hypothetical protein